MAYKVVIGLELHCELKTNSKIFSSARNSHNEIANANVSFVDLGFPGIMPVVNKEAVKKAFKCAMAINCETPNEFILDRKNYYYPDLPKGFQITQVTKPCGINGKFKVDVNGETKIVDIHDLHLEEDTASLDHFSNYSLIDYNRAGVPLIEIVTEPCLYSADEAVSFLESLRQVFIYCDISEAKTEKGQLRCDVNISLMEEDATELGTKVEVKNINSFNNVREAIEYEIKRQTELLDSGGKVIQETRRFDDEKRQTVSMRTKVDNVDYKYFIEPNIPPMAITEEWKEEIRDSIPVLAYERVQIYMDKYNLSRYDADILTKTIDNALYFEEAMKSGIDPKMLANFINTRVLGYVNQEEISINDITFSPSHLVELLNYVNKGTISTKQAKETFYECLKKKKTPKEIVEENDLAQIQDDSYIRNATIKVLDEKADIVKTYDPERPNVLDFFIGQIMKETHGKANPTLARKILKEEIEKRVSNEKI